MGVLITVGINYDPDFNIDFLSKAKIDNFSIQIFLIWSIFHILNIHLSSIVIDRDTPQNIKQVSLHKL